MKIIPVILSGGAGTRLWPLSRALYPKQLWPLVSEKTLLQETAIRVSDENIFAPPVIICNEEHRFIIAEQLRDIGITPDTIILEPAGRNTAPAAAITALRAQKHDPDSLILILPADHFIKETSVFIQSVQQAATATQHANLLVTFGIPPSSPETGYGYIEPGDALPNQRNIFSVSQFCEKPNIETARKFLKTHLWNSGLFLFPTHTFLSELRRFEPDIITACEHALEGAEQDHDFLRLASSAFKKSPSISIDYAVMERTDKAAIMPIEMGWTDLGSWDSLWEISDKNEQGNVEIGKILTQNTKNSYIRSENTLTAVIGLEDIMVVVTDDAVLVCNKDDAQQVKDIVTRLKNNNHTEANLHQKVYRPWGSYQSIARGDRFQVKRITVQPGGKLSLQKHQHRAEHWVVVAGTARVTRGTDVLELNENESTYIPPETIHRLENPTTQTPLEIIEIQSGSYLGEDDIVRLEDSYGRT